MLQAAGRSVEYAARDVTVLWRIGQVVVPIGGVVVVDEASMVPTPARHLVLPHNAADLDDSAYDVAAQASAAWEPQSAGTDDDAAKRLSPGSMVTRRILS